MPWRVICFSILWALGLALLLALLLIFIQEHRRRPVTNTTTATATATATATDDVENQDKDQDSGPHQQSGPPQHPWYRNAVVIPTLTAAIAFSLSVVPHTSCEFMQLSYGRELISIGLWSVAYDKNGDFGGEGICYSNFRTDTFSVDSALTVARVSAILACIVGGIALLVLLYCVLSGHTSLVRRLTGPFLMAAFVQGLTLVVHTTDQCMASPECYADYGSISCITALCFWLLSAFGVSLLPINGNRSSTENQQTTHPTNAHAHASILEPATTAQFSSLPVAAIVTIH
jgi:hypothetical protein